MTWVASTSFVATGVGLCVCLGAALALRVIGSRRWTAATRTLWRELDATRQRNFNHRYDARELEGLPLPVQRYFRVVLKDGQPVVTAATVHHTGCFNFSLAREQWKPFKSAQHVVTRRPGFVWDARIVFLPGIAVHVHDAYIAGTGLLKASLSGLWVMADLHDEGELARGELIRYFAETAWYPTALLPSQGVRWIAVDDHQADATLEDGAHSVTMRVKFDHAGLIETVRFEQRGAMIGNKIVQTPWEGRWSNYAERNGMRVPLTGEAAWITAQGRRPYWRGTINTVSHEFSSISG